MLPAAKEVIMLFPILLSLWEDRPFKPEDLDLGPSPIFIETDELRWQAQGLDYAAEPALRNRMIREIGRSNNPVAHKLLLDVLAEAEDPRTVATVLRQFLRLPGDVRGTAATFEPYLKHRDRGVRRLAFQCYMQTAKADTSLVLELAAEEPAAEVVAAALYSLLPRAGNLRFSALADFRDDDDWRVARAAWQISSRTGDAARHVDEFLAAARTGPLSVRHTLAVELQQMPADVAGNLARQLVGDDAPAVRATAAEGCAPNLLPHGQALLLILLDDTDYEVRRAAVASLKHYLTDEAAGGVVGRFVDRSRFVREAAEESAVALHERGVRAVRELARGMLNSQNRYARYRAFRTAGRIGVGDLIPDIVPAVEQEEVAENIAAAITALYELEADQTGSTFLLFAEHESADVRASVAKAAALLPASRVEALLKRLVKDPGDEVRYQAIIAMGRVGDPVFAGNLLTVLKSTRTGSIYSPRHRAAACWSAARIRPVQDDLAKRVVVQATQRVIPTPMGPVYDTEVVMASAAFGITQMAMADPDTKAQAERVLAFHSRKRGSGMVQDFTPSFTIRECARQARAMYEGTVPEPRQRPTRSVTLSYRKVD